MKYDEQIANSGDPQKNGLGEFQGEKTSSEMVLRLSEDVTNTLIVSCMILAKKTAGQVS